jgi:hypothetical protein
MNKYKGTTKLSLTIRIVVGVYILYTAMSLVKGIPQAVGTEKLLFIAFTVFFTVAGVLLVVFAGKALLYKQYDDGSDKEEDNNDNIEDNNDNLDNIELTKEDELTETETQAEIETETEQDSAKNEES